MEAITERLKNLSPEKRALFQKLLQKKAPQTPENTPAADLFDPSQIKPMPSSSSAPLSFAQTRLWILDQMEPGNPFYHLTAALKISGPLNRDALSRTLSHIVNRHAVLRTTFTLKEDAPIQVIHPAADVALTFSDFGASSDASPPQMEDALLTAECNAPFDLENGPLFRIRLMRLSPDEHVLLFTQHHIISDGWSLGLLIHELSALYNGVLAGQECASILPELPIQYTDFALWQHQALKAGFFDRQLHYWQNQLKGTQHFIDLPLDFKRPALPFHQAGVCRFHLDAATREAVIRVGQNAQATLFMTLLAVYAILLYRFCGKEFFTIGSPIANRNRTETEPLIGFFVNTLVLRMACHDAPSFTSFLAQVRKTCIEAYAHQDLPFEKLVEILQPERNLNQTPLFQVFFALHTAPQSDLFLKGLTVRALERPETTTPFDLYLAIIDQNDGLEGRLIYPRELFQEDTVQRLANGYTELLAGILENPETRIDALPLLSAMEQNQVLVHFNTTQKPLAPDQTIVDLIEKRAATAPDQIALIRQGQTLSYQTLNLRANQIAHELIERAPLDGTSSAARPTDLNARVAVFMDRSEQVIVSFYGILKAGFAYVPVDTAYPLERVRLMLEDSQCVAVLTDHAHVSLIEGLDLDIQIIDVNILIQMAENPAPNPGRSIPQDALSYVVYTSGSTGAPKGVMQTHRCVHNLITWQMGAVGAEHVILQYAALTFDVSIQEILFSLASGSTLHVIPEHLRYNMPSLAQYLLDHQITLFIMPFSALNLLFKEGGLIDQNPHLRHIITSGETFLMFPELKHYLNRFPQVCVHNQYGPSETHVVTAHTFSAETHGIPEAPSIGRPIDNTRILILDTNKTPVPIGVAGELFIAGHGLARGYLNQDALTTEKFIPDPFAPGTRMYATGDMGRWLPDGTIEFQGRRDDQVKIRGHRIELNEIEICLLKHPRIKAAAVTQVTSPTGDKELAAYLVGESPLDLTEVKSHIASVLPHYMVPTYFMPLAQMPLTTSGKVDRKRLPDPREEHIERKTDGLSPQKPLEKMLADLWCQVLGYDPVGLHDHFFDLGGDSIKAIRLISRCHQKGWHLEIRDVFQSPRLKELARTLVPLPPSPKAEIMTGEALLSGIQHWFFQCVTLAPHHYNQAVLLIGRQRFDAQKLASAVIALWRRHDALHFIYLRQKDPIRQTYGAQNTRPFYAIQDLRAFDQETAQATYLSHARKIQAQFDLASGPLMSVILYRFPSEDRIVMILHHLVADAFSFHILLEELTSAYQALLEERPWRFPPPTTPFRTWTEKLNAYGNSLATPSEREYWRNALSSEPPALFAETALASASKAPSQNTVADAQTVMKGLSWTTDRSIWGKHHQDHGIRIEDFLWTALSETLYCLSGQQTLPVMMTSHGREPLFNDIDLSRSVGWFATLYPVALAHDPQMTPLERLLTTRDIRQALPNAMSYLIYRYLIQDEIIAKQKFPEILFNYMGQIDADMPSGAFTVSPEPPPGQFHPAQPRPFALDFTVMVLKEELRVALTYDRIRFGSQLMESLLDVYLEALRRLMDSV